MKKQVENKVPIKLNEIPKKEHFEVPERYFDGLPLKIQSRIPDRHKRETVFYWKPLLKWSPVMLVLIALGGWWFTEPNPTSGTPSFEAQLALVSDEEILVYLEQSELSTEDILEALTGLSLTVEEADIDNLLDEEMNDEDLDKLILDNLNTEEYYN